MSESKDSGHGHAKDYTIVVNGEGHVVGNAIVTYEQVVSIGFPTPPSPETKFTVTFRKAHEPKEGSLIAGMSVEVKVNGTIFNVKATGKS